MSCGESVIDFAVLDPDINFSDHLPLYITVLCKASVLDTDSMKTAVHPVQRHPRWDKADLCAYYELTGHNLTPLLTELDNMLSSTFVDSNDIDRIYNDIISVLIDAEAKFVPKSNK